jgi:hypothetical protein
MPRRNRRTENERDEPMQNNDLDDAAISRGHRDDMRATPAHGDRLDEQFNENEDASENEDSSSFSGQGAQKEGSVEDAEGTGYTGRSNAEQDTRENSGS